MAAEPLTLEEIVAKATDITNYKSNDAESLSVANQVNREIGGPHSCVKLLIQRLQLRQEVVTLQALNVLECCVKNCGAKFHNEIGKYKFINELIKLLSPKYDADITPQTVKDRVTELLFAWYVGLPQEKKIGEAYKMLKQQGIIKKDPIDPYQQGTPLPPREAQNTAFEDEGKSELLKTLLTSTDPDDLQSANKLIKTMVKEEEQRLERVSKRIQELETVSNNVRLLDEMLAKYTQNSTHTDLEIMNDLYESCLKLRPELFRLASRSAEDKDDAMAEILCASDELTRVIDSYKEIVLMKEVDRSKQKPYNVSDSDNANSLLDLGFDNPPSTSTDEKQHSSTGNALLDEQFKFLGLDVQDETQNSSFEQFSQFNQSQQPTMQQPNHNFSMNMSQPGGFIGQPPFHPTATTGATTNIQPLIGVMRPPSSNTPNAATPPPMSAPNKNTTNTNTTPQRKDILDFDVFNDFKNNDFGKPKQTAKKSLDISSDGNAKKFLDTTDGASQSAIDSLLDLSMDDLPSPMPISSSTSHSAATDLSNFNLTPVQTTPLPSVQTTPLPPANQPTANTPQPQTKSTTPSSSFSTPQQATTTLPATTPVVTQQAPQPPAVAATGTPSQDSYLVPLDKLKPGTHDPIVVLDKNSLKTFLNVATDTRPGANPNVLVTILSTISMNTGAVKDFTVQVAVPKVMRVKLQPATSNELAPFNPILPPPSITQIMLIANPNKESVRLRFRITYTLNGVEYAENASIDQLPTT